ncbi:MAG: sel1 repeat family protein [Polyangiaceae bacterium]|nr:sel1 repeat family protein [Polyangiaceae bacterium]
MQMVSKWILLGALVSLASACKSDPPAPKVTADSAKLKAAAAPSASASATTAAPAPYGPDDLLADIPRCADHWLSNAMHVTERCEKALALWSEGGVEAVVAKHKAACDGGDGKACTLLIGGLGHPKSPMQSKNKAMFLEDVAALQIKACGLGEPNACVAIVDQYTCYRDIVPGETVQLNCATRINEWLKGKKREDLAAALEPGCKKGHAKSCTDRGMHLKAVKGQVDEVTDHYKKGCDLGDPRGCWQAELIAKVFGDEVEIRSLKSKKFALQERECRRFRDCHDIAADYDRGWHLPEHLPKIRELLTFYCEKKAPDDSSCVELAVMQVKGDGAPADVAAGLARLNAVCDKPITSQDDAGWIEPIAKGCRPLARFYKDGTGVEKDVAKAKALLKKVCVQREMATMVMQDACNDLKELEK